MHIKDLKKHFFDRLAEKYSAEETGSFFNLLVLEFMGLSRLKVALNPEKIVSENHVDQFEEAVQRLLKDEPIQYIIGHTEFYGLNFKVNPEVLISRPETEELVEWILKEHNSKPGENLKILDIGTGSGCIAIALASNLENAEVSAIDISKGALDTARENALANAVEINFIQADILELKELPETYDIIVSNPPYVREQEKQAMQPNVLNHEPARALYVQDSDPLIFYRKITELATKSLSKKGNLYFEINQYLAEETKMLLEQKNFYTSLKKDIFGEYRMLRGYKE